ncbi:SDR family oxidoreductase [Oceanibacterium hippocampi]|uniref:Glucose 1-dehydrogenase 1 n=1 Tax=Oceanibacterium hippocampi TaxID=745714 RepID=A0A1Y5T8J9_9PROT|nr:SDR family oxidoreductase [Oceanibacterium hippocampi]SLN54754.1 Glucose 1-dehydrogenase 1 [Oceanibacterium hippocampi]
MSKRILITGASRGIGRAVALLAGHRRWSVAVNYRDNRTAAEQTVNAVRAAGGTAIAVRGDVSSEADVIAMFDAATDAFGGLDGVVNNAGVVAPASPLADMTLERLRRIFDINVLGAYLVAREAARRMSLASGGQGGAIVNLSSAAARLGSPNEYVDYAGAKAAIDTMTIGLAKELGPAGIRVNAIRPGLIETEIHASGGAPDRAERLGKMTPMGRAGTAEEAAEAVIWLLDDRSSYVTGALLDVSGGR